MERICLFCWNDGDAQARTRLLEEGGLSVTWEGSAAPDGLRRVGALAPDAVIIDLDRLPSQGRDLAVRLRMAAGTRRLPLVLAGGAPDKVESYRRVIPDAVYTDWPCAAEAVRAAIASPPTDPVVPASVFAAFEGVPLWRKLAIKEGSTVALIGAPGGIRKAIDPLPPGVELREGEGTPSDLTIWFVRSKAEMDAGMEMACGQAAHGPVWIAWPKRAACPATDLNQQRVRAAGLAVGLVDYKICSIDATWSGLLFRQRKA